MSENILIYRIGQLGDTLIAMPAIQAIASRHPGARLVLMTDRHPTPKGFISSWDVLRPLGWFDEVIFYEPAQPGIWSRVVRTLGLLQGLRQHRFTHVYNLARRTSAKSVWRDRLFFKALGAGEYRTLPILVHPPARGPDGRLVRLEPEWRRLRRSIDPAQAAAPFAFRVPETARREAADLWPDFGGPVVALGPGSKMAAKRWPEQRFAEVGARLLERYGDLAIVVVGGPEDREVGERLCSAWGPRTRSVAGQLSVFGSAALMERCALYVGNDTGTMHLAALVGLPCVAIFSARDYPGMWEPFGDHNRILRKEVECAGCMLETCVVRRNACLDSITVEEVVDAAAAAFADRAADVRTGPRAPMTALRPVE